MRGGVRPAGRHPSHVASIDHHTEAGDPDGPDGYYAGGYYRWPSLHGNRLVFVCEDDLYAVDDVVNGGRPTRLTDAPGPVRRPVISPDGEKVAFVVEEEGGVQEVYVASIEGGPIRQITHHGAAFARVACWSPDGTRVFFVSSFGQPFTDQDELWHVPASGVGRENDRLRNDRAEPSRARVLGIGGDEGRCAMNVASTRRRGRRSHRSFNRRAVSCRVVT